ncbi:MAG: histidinol-phosphatase HisJ family protein [Lachnospiraceae bacterium]|nr:histidinol-phosphatase HisJ family protein [Lachnospiraceae bacterium]
MSVLADCHLHSSFSGDSEAPMEEMIQKAISLGMREMCFTEHMDFDFIYTPEEPEGFYEVNTDAYLYDLLKYREKYREQIKILFGIELGMQTTVTRKNLLYVKNYDFDFVIASSHLCNGKDPYLKETFFEGRPEAEAYHEYFQYIYECIRSFQNFDVYGHLDYVLRYGPTKNENFRFEEYRTDIDRILKLLIENGKGIEANTSGYAYGMGGPHPCRDILARYKELGGEILTIGSDAHRPGMIGSHFEDTAEMLKEIGFEYYCVFENRMPEYHKL